MLSLSHAKPDYVLLVVGVVIAIQVLFFSFFFGVGS